MTTSWTKPYGTIGAGKALYSICEAELRRRLADMQKRGPFATLDSLKRYLEDRKARQARVMAAIEVTGDVRSLAIRLRELEEQVRRIEEAIRNHRPVQVDATVAEIGEYVTKSLLGLRELLSSRGETEVARAKTAIATHIGKLVLIPTIRDGRPVYGVTGAVAVRDDKCRMQLVARDGIQRHYIGLRLPLTGLQLDPRLDLVA